MTEEARTEDFADEGLDGKVAIVTGAGARDDGIGNGRAAAMLLADAGTRVLVVDRLASAAERTVEMITGNGGVAAAFEADVTTDTDCEAMVAKALELWGRLDVLDNNVGVGSRGSVVDESRSNWRRVMKINVESVFLASKTAVPAMTATGAGVIVNVSSIAAIRPRGMTAYSTSKSAIVGLTQAMAVDHGPDGIRVNCVAPGPVYTPMVYQSGMSKKARDARVRASVLGIEGTGWDVGNAVRFLASKRARYITGQTLIVDGGVTLQGPERDASG
ncbi:MAG: SDR family NAD(P)-dependent oxidoreductase [Pseudomonadales bacterium]